MLLYTIPTTARLITFSLIHQITDINECGLDKGGCDHKCVNKAGWYHCVCEDGYSLQSDNRTCVASKLTLYLIVHLLDNNSHE